MKRPLHQAPYELLQQDRYTPEEVAEVLWVSINVVRHAVFTGELPAQIIEHDITSIQRDDVLAWLEASDGRNRADLAQTDRDSVASQMLGITRIAAGGPARLERLAQFVTGHARPR